MLKINRTAPAAKWGMLMVLLAALMGGGNLTGCAEMANSSLTSVGSDLDGDGWPACQTGEDPEDDGCDPDDTDPSIGPEICGDGIDNDGDGEADEADDCRDSGPDGTPVPGDQDDDGYTEAEGDCNDYDASIGPEAPEICGDGIDNDCDGELAEGAVDADGQVICAATDYDGDGYAAAHGDCDETNPAIHPGADDVCDGVDNDCNGDIDDGIFSGATEMWIDADFGLVDWISQGQDLVTQEMVTEQHRPEGMWVPTPWTTGDGIVTVCGGPAANFEALRLALTWTNECVVWDAESWWKPVYEDGEISDGICVHIRTAGQ